MMERCATCGEWKIGTDMHGNYFHNCPPKWNVRIPEWDGRDDEDWSDVYAYDESAAAEKYVESSDHDSTVAANSSIICDVMGPDGAIKHFEVFGEFEPRYRATDVTDQPAEK